MSKLNKLLKKWPPGTVATAAGLQKQGVYRQLARQYVAGGWLEPLGRGAFVRSGEKPDWLGGLYALQSDLGLDIHAAATTALSLKGLGHYLPLGKPSEVILFGQPGTRLPAWFARHDWQVRLTYRTPKLFSQPDSTSLTTVERGGFAVRVSAPERAMLETLHLATTNEAIRHADELMAGLVSLRPQILQPLLETCRSVKAKRLFLWAAEAAGHPWLERLAVDRVDLGTGKRQAYRGGRLDPKYQITVPRREEARV